MTAGGNITLVENYLLFQAGMLYTFDMDSITKSVTGRFLFCVRFVYGESVYHFLCAPGGFLPSPLCKLRTHKKRRKTSGILKFSACDQFSIAKEHYPTVKNQLKIILYFGNIIPSPLFVKGKNNVIFQQGFFAFYRYASPPVITFKAVTGKPRFGGGMYVNL